MNHSHDEAVYIENAEALYQAGYRAASPANCPYPVASSGRYVIWMQGYHQHQTDRRTVAEAAAHPWCRHPLRPAF